MLGRDAGPSRRLTGRMAGTAGFSEATPCTLAVLALALTCRAPLPDHLPKHLRPNNPGHPIAQFHYAGHSPAISSEKGMR